jgi:2-methylisocitrate lyase-like PEP mutase family enzyme
MNNYQKFLQLHCNPSPFLLGNIWDVHSAKIFAENGYGAIGTSSHAIAAVNGYKDGEQMPFEILLQAAQRIAQAVSVPFTVDMEAGYSRTAKGIIDNIEKLHAAGVVGINIEDSVPGIQRNLADALIFAETVAAIAAHITKKNLPVFLNIRTDAFLLGMPTALEETILRVKVYEKAGANGIFVPGIIRKTDISAIVNATLLPINVMCMPGLRDFDELGLLGVKRISMGGFFYNKIYEGVQQLSKSVLTGNDFSSII